MLRRSAEVRKLDILVNNAGVMGPETPLLEQDTDEYVQTIDTNFIGVYRITKALLPLMLEGGLKTVVMVGSVGSQGASCCALYGIAKFALHGSASFDCSVW